MGWGATRLVRPAARRLGVRLGGVGGICRSWEGPAVGSQAPSARVLINNPEPF